MDVMWTKVKSESLTPNFREMIANRLQLNAIRSLIGWFFLCQHQYSFRQIEQLPGELIITSLHFIIITHEYYKFTDYAWCASRLTY